MLTLLISVFTCYLYFSRMGTKRLMLQNYIFYTNKYGAETNEKIIQLEDNSRDLALIGELYYQTDRSPDLTNDAITKIFNNYPESLGGGIWFEPYVVNPNQKRNCFYVYRNKDGEIVLDKEFASDKYDYHNQSWYKEITAQIRKGEKTAWSLPYHEQQGSLEKMITVGTGIYNNKGKLVGISTVDWKIDDIMSEISKMKPVENGFSFYEDQKKGTRILNSFALFANRKHNYIISTNTPGLDDENLMGKTLDNIPWYRNDLYYITYIKYNGETYTPFAKEMDNGMELIICVPKKDMYINLDKIIMHMVLALLLFILLMPTVNYIILHRNILRPIDKLMEIAREIGRGEDISIKIEKPEEFAELASTFDKMTKDIKTATRDKAKIVSELSIAKTIQESSLPSVFPAYPERDDFDIFASMEPARDVGGDFYDFNLTDDDNFMFLIADVSGKGIPAALFMMTTKTLINTLSQISSSPKGLINVANDRLCKHNKQGYFVTMLGGIINLKENRLSLINCGHNKPLIRRKDGSYEYLDLEPNVPLGIFENFDFNVYETEFQKGDILFTYTDGVTEAMNDQEKMYGEERLLKSLNEIRELSNPKEIISTIKKDVKNFVNGTEQSDDITMLCFEYGKELSTKKTYYDVADIKNFEDFYGWLNDTLVRWDTPKEIMNKIFVCAEEIFVNVASYAYQNKKGKIKVSTEKADNKITLKFEDSGVEYNPLKKEDPDINLPPEERPIGGLGIFMVKNTANEVSYERLEDKNIFTMVFEV